MGNAKYLRSPGIRNRSGSNPRFCEHADTANINWLPTKVPAGLQHKNDAGYITINLLEQYQKESFERQRA